jgi:hypothetical protein
LVYPAITVTISIKLLVNLVCQRKQTVDILGLLRLFCRFMRHLILHTQQPPHIQDSDGNIRAPEHHKATGCKFSATEAAG